MVRCTRWISGPVFFILMSGIAVGQAFPTKPIRIVTYEAGGGTDFVTRLIAPEVSVSLGQPIVIDNRPASVTADIISKAPPDGYTLYVAANSLWIVPLMQKTSYDTLRDFAPVALATRSPNVLVVYPSVATSVKELIAVAKAKPGALNYGRAASGAVSHLAAELFKVMAGVNIVDIPYKSGGLSVNALLSNEIQLSFPGAATVAPHIESGRIRALAVTSAQPSAIAPELPTIAASGLPGYAAENLIGFLAPAKTPVAVINRINQEIARALSNPDVKEKFVNVGSEIVASFPNEFTKMIKDDMERMGKVIKQVGIHAD